MTIFTNKQNLTNLYAIGAFIVYGGQTLIVIMIFISSGVIEFVLLLARTHLGLTLM